MGLFNKVKTTNLLAREIKMDENPTGEDPYLYVEGDETGFVNWILKKLGLKDPSVSLSISDKYITLVTGKKHFSITPTAQIHNFDTGFAKDKSLLIKAIFSYVGGLGLPIIDKLFGFRGDTTLIAFLLLIAGTIFLWLYSKSGAMIVGLSTFNGSGNERINVKSGMTGNKLDKSGFEKLFNSLKSAVSKNSKYF